ncbi:MAG TPA: LuxR C-terminal-related transcriptional regulator [Polyangiaceae bacterium LLY-WYZ-15_(1-7)]|nr:LuxR C-terminal-related transcriptional regulator [Polyangiaceae bacterium LLY-WYZ-15_(1-7)]
MGEKVIRSLAGPRETAALERFGDAMEEALEADGYLVHMLAWQRTQATVVGQLRRGMSRVMAIARNIRVGIDPMPIRSWSVDLPDWHEREHAVSLDLRLRRMHRQDWRWVHEDMYPIGLHDMARKLVYDGRRFVAVISVERARDRAVFDAEDLRRMDAVSDVWLPVLTAARAMDADLVRESCALLFRPSGRVVHVSPRAEAWTTEERRRALGEAVKRTDGARRESAQVFVGGTVARIARVRVGARSRYLVTLRPTVAPLMHPAADLSERQREVAAYAAAGATAKEIGETLGIREATVRRHLAAVYAVLGVGRRAALRRVLDETSLAPR